MLFPFLDAPLARRRFLVGAASSAALAASGAARAAPASGVWRPDFNDPNDNLQAYMKLTSSLDGQTVYSWFGGHFFSLVEGQTLKPLFGLEGFGVGSAHRQADGTYRTGWKEVGFYKDLATEQVIDTWTNPLGDRTEVLHIQNRSVAATIAPSFKRLSGGPPGMDQSDVQYASYRRPGDASLPFVLPWWQVGDSVTLAMDVSAVMTNPLPPEEWPRESSGARIRIAEQTMHTGQASVLFDPSKTKVDYVGAWNRFSPWLPWMLMGGQPGGVFLRATHRRLTGFDELPRTIRSYAEKNFPAWLDPTVDPNMTNESSWEVFKRTRKPQPRR